MQLSFDKSLILHIAHDGLPIASAHIGLAHGSDNLLNGNLQDVKINNDSATGSYLLPSDGVLRLEIHLERIAPQAVSLSTRFANTGTSPIKFDRFAAPGIHLKSTTFPPHAPLWTMQGAAVHWGQDFAFPLTGGFARDNFLGHLQDGEGGGIPLVYFWNKTHGIALMHIEPQPRDWYLPVRSGKEGVSTALELRKSITLQPGKSIEGLHTVISLHAGDFFAPLAFYREQLAAQGLSAPEPVPANYEPAWCSWGYEFDVRPSEMLGVLPALEPLNIKWLTLDDRWFDYYGDWNPRPDTFPGGADEMRRMVDEIHRAGSFAQIWWYPLCAEDGHGRWDDQPYKVAPLLKAHPDWVILNADGSVARNNRHLAMLCPAVPEVREHTARLTRKFIAEWGLDGHKLDNIYTVPACHNPAHRHDYPEQSTEAMAEAYKLIFDITRELRPDSVTQICPCGTPLSLQLIPFTDQTVTADPTSSAQIRQRIKFYKALMGAHAAVFADHVELSDEGADFASEIGTGGVPATKFIYPDDAAVRARLKEVWNFPLEKQSIWKKWFDLYNTHRISEGEYLNLYDMAFDKPETHVIRKDNKLYFAFYSEVFSGELTLRGLEDKAYRVFDYVNDKLLGTVHGPTAKLQAAFTGALLVVVE